MTLNGRSPAHPDAARVDRVAMLSFHTSPLAPLGGSETGGMNVYVREVARHLGRLGVAVDVFTRRDDPETPDVTEFGEGARLVQVDAGPAARVEKEALPQHVPAFADGVRAFARRQGLRYDVLHSHYWLSALAGEEIARAWDVPHLAMFHTLGQVKLRARASEHEPRERLDAEARLVHAVDGIVAATAHERQLLRQLYRVAPSRVEVIPLGVDLERFRPRARDAAREALGIRPEERIVLAVGRIQPLKGLDILVRSLAEVTDRTGLSLLIIGGDERAAPEVGRLSAIAEEVGVADAVRFLGPIPHEELPAYYNAADVVAVPSFYESFGLVAVEAMASGTPVVASRVGGLASTVADGRTGYLIPWRCPEPFAEKIELLLRNEPLRAALGRAGVERMQAYSWTSVAERLVEVYAHAIEMREAEPAVAAGGA
jgi:D-inositol-3-phosphate glycosyltransferase